MKETTETQRTEASASFPGDAHPPDFRTVYERFKRPIHSYIYRLLGSWEDADDVTQEVFLRAHVLWHDLHDHDHLSSWLHRLATNASIDLLRRRQRLSWWPLTHRHHKSGSGEAGVDEDATYLPFDSGGIPEIAERDLIKQALAQLPEEYSVVLVLSAAQGVPYQEIATIVGISPNAAATRISRAKKMFAEHYERLSREGAGKQEKRR